MSNIEIHGLSEEKAEELRNRIFQLFQGKPYVDEIVVTVFPTRCYDRHGTPQPFVRLVSLSPMASSSKASSPLDGLSERISSHTVRSDEIIGVLVELNMDIEELLLDRFIPRDRRSGN